MVWNRWDQSRSLATQITRHNATSSFQIVTSSAESQKGVNVVQQCPVENQKGAIAIDFEKRLLTPFFLKTHYSFGKKRKNFFLICRKCSTPSENTDKPTSTSFELRVFMYIAMYITYMEE